MSDSKPFYVRVLREITDYVYDDCVVAALRHPDDSVSLLDGVTEAADVALANAKEGEDYEVLPPLVEFDKTGRGFQVGEFTDRYGERCTIQDSSLATEAAIWLGIHDPKVQIMARDAPEEWLAPKGDPERHNGWVVVPLPEKAQLSGRMHLTQAQVIQLLPHLQRFAETGSIAPVEEGDG